MIDRTLKQSLGQMVHGVQVVAARHDGMVRAYTSHWVMQVSFAEPMLMASISPRHDTYPLVQESGRFTVSVLAADQVAQGQYFSYPGRRFHRIATEYLTDWPDDPKRPPIVAGAITALDCEVTDTVALADHVLLIARVVDVAPGRLGTPALVYSSRVGWRVVGERARESGAGIRDALLARLEAAGLGPHESDEPTDNDD
ncbi:MAG: flavin reductase family protein [Ilumatobacteraceae bacterium]